MPSRSAQVSAEFVIIFAFVAGGFILSTGIILEMITESRSQEERASLDSIGDKINNEVTLASVVHDNYKRFFSLPDTLDGVDYEIKLNPYSPPDSNNSEVILYVESGDKLSYTRQVFLRHVDIISIGQGCNMLTRHNSTTRIEKVEEKNC